MLFTVENYNYDTNAFNKPSESFGRKLYRFFFKDPVSTAGSSQQQVYQQPPQPAYQQNIPQEAVKFCSQCGRKNETRANFCAKCGSRL